MAKVLLVEDDNNLREIFEMRLQAEGYQTLGANDGEEALVLATREKPDLIIADIMMPKLSGFEMIENLRAAPGMSDVKVIMMTALGQAEDRARGEKLAVVKYLVKSQVTLEDFVRVVREVLPVPTVSRDSDQSVGAEGGNKASSDAAGEEKTQNSTNKEESEQVMQNDNINPNQPVGGPPQDDSTPAANPVTGSDASAAPAGDQTSTADEQGAVDQQVNSFASQTPASDPASPADMPASTPSSDPTPMGGGMGDSAGQDMPTPEPPTQTPPGDGSPQPPTDQPPQEGGPSGPPPTPGM